MYGNQSALKKPLTAHYAI